MTKSQCFIVTGAAIALTASAIPQQPPDGATIEQRVAALEAGLATLDTRVGLASTSRGDTGQSELRLDARIAALERAVERLSVDVQRVERLADSASRAASEAQRDAASAQQAARDAALRAR